jgi:hypothetical protein
MSNYHTFAEAAGAMNSASIRRSTPSFFTGQLNCHEPEFRSLVRRSGHGRWPTGSNIFRAIRWATCQRRPSEQWQHDR